MSSEFFHRDATSRLCVEGLSLDEIAQRVGTPCYVYSQAAIEQASKDWQQAFAGRGCQLCYSVKANSNLSILRLLDSLGWDFDIVSGGELERLLHIGVAPGRVRFSGVGKTRAELQRAVAAGIGAVHLESFGEAELLCEIASEQQQRMSVAVRINPDTPAGGSSAISTAKAGDKFGVPLEEAERLYDWLKDSSHLVPSGMACHLGSQIDSEEPYVEALKKLLSVMNRLTRKGISLTEVDLGGGAAIAAEGIRFLPPETLAGALLPIAKEAGLKLVLSPGRSLTARAGVLLTRTLYCKKMAGKHILIVDAGMNDYARPSLYGLDPKVLTVGPPDEQVICELAGPVCESTDFLARSAALPFRPDLLLSLMDTGAYGMTMSSNYNSRLRPAEVLVRAGGWEVIRRRETTSDLLAPEREI